MFNFMSYKKIYFPCLANVVLKPHTKVLKILFHNMALKNIYDHYITVIFKQQGNLEALIQTRLKGYYNNAINVRISLNRYGSKIRKVSRCKAIVSNEATLEATQEFFFAKVAPVQSITDIALLGFCLILLPRMFI